MKNKLTDANNYIFEQIEKLNDDDMTDSQAILQIKKAEAVSELVKTVIQIETLRLNAIKVAAENGYVKKESFQCLLGGPSGEQNEKIQHRDV